jgi:hypothetical protein
MPQTQANTTASNGALLHKRHATVHTATIEVKDAERFWKKVDKNGPAHGTGGQCWRWLGTRDGKGYGQLYVKGRMIRAHRFSYFLHNNTPSDSCVLHRCDNANCVNPEHLFLGSQADNMADMKAKGRARGGTSSEQAPKGEQNYMAILNQQQVIEIRRRYRRWSYHGSNARQLGQEFGVSRTAIVDVVSRRNWRHVA